MSEDLIKRSDAINAINQVGWLEDSEYESRILAVPSADRPQGKWIDVWQDGICSWRGTCSVCRSTNDIPPPFEANYCPYCGARMKGADDE